MEPKWVATYLLGLGEPAARPLKGEAEQAATEGAVVQELNVLRCFVSGLHKHKVCEVSHLG